MKKKGGRGRPFFFSPYGSYLIEAASSLPGRNRATRRALIWIVSPVCGLRPTRAFRLETEKVPNPTSATLSPFLRDFVTPSTRESRVLPAVVLLIRPSFAIFSMRSALFMGLLRKQRFWKELGWPRTAE